MQPPRRSESAPAPAAPRLWVCPSCGWEVRSPFCAGCGERPLESTELTIRGLLGQLTRIFTNIDGRVIYSFRCLVNRPGLLTLAFLNGQRQPYLGPFQLFILANLLFFALQSFLSEFRPISTLLELAVGNQPGAGLARILVAEHLAVSGLTFEAYAPIYNQAVSVNAKSLIGLMVLPFSLFPPLVFWRSAHPYAVHVVFALHFYTFLLLLFCVPLAALIIDSALGGTGTLTQRADDILSVTLLLSCGTYLFLSCGRVYDTRGVARVLQTLVLTAAVVGIFLGYRFLLLPITLATT